MASSSEIICHTHLECGSTSGNQVKVCLASLDAILLTSHEWVSDSWTIIFLRSIDHATTTGNATYHHLQNMTSIRYISIKKKA